ncbi:hypothetical protein [Actinomadura nitritigenes]|uniref:hypothetical protein n=1 Tax=Actinomadura nitritigenes TaxID=134602 RepID=UPI003D940DA5
MTGSAAVWQRTADIPLDGLTPFPGNARRGDVASILDSLRQNAQYRSLVVRDVGDGTLVVLTGNQTLEALERHGPGRCDYDVQGETEGGARCALCSSGEWQGTARCEIITCDGAAAARINVGDNRIHDLGGYDNRALADLLQELPDLGGTGYSTADLDGLMRVSGKLAEQAADFLAPFKDQPLPGPAPAGAASEPGPAPLTPRQGVTQTIQPPPEAPYSPPEQINPPHTSATAESLVPVQWTVTVQERDRIRSTLRAAQQRFGAPDASTTLVLIIDSFAASLAAAEETP